MCITICICISICPVLSVVVRVHLYVSPWESGKRFFRFFQIPLYVLTCKVIDNKATLTLTWLWVQPGNLPNEDQNQKATMPVLNSVLCSFLRTRNRDSLSGKIPMLYYKSYFFWPVFQSSKNVQNSCPQRILSLTLPTGSSKCIIRLSSTACSGQSFRSILGSLNQNPFALTLRMYYLFE